ncbi:hypothetical protein HGG76_05910 [Ochrobactrum tritici]|uniref:Uncharacterized protein n=1 Tax=Brucella tritici TaxID=94626 RepID=A0A7X6FQZ9_9HYPH|nr:hypothetical protein [Brucella tritici]
MADNLEIKAKLDSAQAKALMQKLSGPRMYQALSVAVNDSARQVERKAESIVAKTLSIPLKRARLGIWIRPFSTPQTLTAVIKGSGSVIPLKAFKAKEDGDGVTAKIWGKRFIIPEPSSTAGLLATITVHWVWAGTSSIVPARHGCREKRKD